MAESRRKRRRQSDRASSPVSGNDLFSPPTANGDDAPGDTHGTTIRTSDVTSPQRPSEISDRDSSPHTERLFSSPPHAMPTSEMDMMSSPLQYGTPSSRVGTPGSRMGTPGRHTPVRPRHDVRSERRMRQVNVAPSDPPTDPTSVTSSEAQPQVHLVIWGTDVNVQETKEKFKDFLKYFMDDLEQAGEEEPIGGVEPYYMVRLDEVNTLEDPFLSVSCDHLRQYNQELYRQLVRYPQEVIPTFDMGTNELFQQLYPDTCLEHQIQVRPYNVEKTKNMRMLNPDDIDQLITIGGMVIRLSSLVPEMREAFFECAICHSTATVEIDRGRIAEPTVCTHCNAKYTMTLVHNRSYFTDKQMVKLQESPVVEMHKMLSSCARDGDRLGKQRSDQIDRELLKQASAKEDIVKLLLLGAGESGKSTFVKQMKIIHGDGYSIDELNNFINIIHGNLLTSMVQVIKAMDKLNITLHNPSSQVYASKIINFPTPLEHGMVIPSEIGEKIKLLWDDDGFQECLKHVVEYQLNDSAPYYFQNMDRILDPSYTPTEQDVLQSRVQTTGVVETSFKQGNITYRLFDVGGQRSERRKWLHCFDDVKVVLFMAVLSGYDITLIEDGTTNRMEESLNLFQAVCVNKFFDRSSIILFLNKVDLFTEKINNTNHHLRLYFPHYNGPDHDVSAAKEFILSQFLACNPLKGKLIYPHFTTATDTNNIKVVFKVVLETIIHEKMTAQNLV